MSAVPLNAIAIWTGTIASIPSEWNLCNGGGTTPDLRDKFLRGAPAATEAGGTGGNNNHTHTEQSTGAHTHTTSGTVTHTHTTSTSSTHVHGSYAYASSGSGVNTSNRTAAGAHGHTTTTGTSAHTHTADSQGAHVHTLTDSTEARPPWYDVLYIQASGTATVYTGIRIIWSDLVANIPTGWSEDTNLRSNFPRGASNGIGGGGTGGSADHTHATQSSTGHTHSGDSQGAHTHAFTNDLNAHTHGTQGSTSGARTVQTAVSYNWYHQHATSNSLGAHTHTFQSGGIHSDHGNVGSADSNKSLPSYKQTVYIKNDSATTLPIGGILIWVGTIANIPASYLLCDGTSSTPDYRTYFLRGNPNGGTVGATGGADSHLHTDNVGGIHSNHTQDAFSTAHQHTTTDSIGAHTHGTVSGTRTSGANMNVDDSIGNHSHTYTNDAWSHTHTIVDSASHTHTIDTNTDTRPPFYQVQFIQKNIVPLFLSATENIFSRHTGFPVRIWGSKKSVIESPYIRHTGFPTRVWTAKNTLTDPSVIRHSAGSPTKIWSILRTLTESSWLRHLTTPIKIWIAKKLVLESPYIRHTGTPINIWVSKTSRLETPYIRHTGFPTKIWTAKKLLTESSWLRHLTTPLRIWTVKTILSEQSWIRHTTVSYIKTIKRLMTDTMNALASVSPFTGGGNNWVKAVSETFNLSLNYTKIWTSKKLITEQSYVRQTGFPIRAWTLFRSATEGSKLSEVKPTSVDSGLLLWLPFDEGTGINTNDASLHGNNGTLTNNATWINTGKYGKAVSYSSTTSDYVYIPSVTGMSALSAITITGWIYLTGAADKCPIKSNSNYFIFRSSGVAFYLVNYLGTPSNYLNWGANTPATGSWQHIAATYDGTTMTVYCNSTYSNSMTWAGGNLGPISNITIGGNMGSATYFDGYTDEFRIFNTSFNQTQVTEDYNRVRAKVQLVNSIKRNPTEQVSLTGNLTRAWSAIKRFVQQFDIMRYLETYSEGAFRSLTRSETIILGSSLSLFRTKLIRAIENLLLLGTTRKAITIRFSEPLNLFLQGIIDATSGIAKTLKIRIIGSSVRRAKMVDDGERKAFMEYRSSFNALIIYGKIVGRIKRLLRGSYG